MSGGGFKIFKWAVVTVAIAFNILVYFYPDILNDLQQCKWHEFSDSGRLKSKLDFINGLDQSISDKILLNLPFLQDIKMLNTKSPYDLHNDVKDIHLLAFGDPQINGNWALTKYIKRLDNYGNDYYLGHIYTTMKERLSPSHVAVMGDHFSSQWIYDSEFYNRTYRYVERIFTRPIEYKQNVLDVHERHEDYDWQKWLSEEVNLDPLVRFNSRVYNDVYDWYNLDKKYPNFENPLFINLTGNHDIGYSGDATWQHMARFHLLFGQNNYVINYNKGTPEEWRIIVLDSLTLEGPALQEEFLNYTWSFVNNIEKYENKDFKGSTILFTHIPFYKREGLCKDGPEHKYYVNNTQEPYKNGKLRSQNHLSYDSTQKIMNIMFPKDSKNGIILTGHDHYGCNSWYNLLSDTWEASESVKPTGERFAVREIVVESMMGDFDGQTGILTGHFDKFKQTWLFEFTYCSFLVQHYWWSSKILTVVAVFLLSTGFLFKW